MGNKLLFLGLFYTLLYWTSAKGAEPDRLANTIEEEQSVVEEALEGMSAQIIAMEERWNQKLSKVYNRQTNSLNQNVNELDNQLTKSPDFVPTQKRPAEFGKFRIILHVHQEETRFERFTN
uniref:Skin calcitonin gene-related peptide n=1 Tax=Zeugodacus cucurbitae TaxID=28588 RepID=A0A0A1XSS6_ZEUCU